MKKTVTWILIADAGHAHVARNDGPGQGVRLLDRPRFDVVVPPGRELLADRPGRSHESVGGARHAMEPPTDPREVEKLKFLRQVAETMGREATAGRYDRLVVVAPPRALGELRQLLPAAARRRVSGELAKDLTHVAERDLAGHLATVLAA